MRWFGKATSTPRIQSMQSSGIGNLCCCRMVLGSIDRKEKIGMSANRNARQILAFGQVGQDLIEAQSVAIVGLGGLGAHVAQGLAYLGVKKYILIDDDVLTETNLNRTPGAFP